MTHTYTYTQDDTMLGIEKKKEKHPLSSFPLSDVGGGKTDKNTKCRLMIAETLTLVWSKLWKPIRNEL